MVRYYIVEKPTTLEGEQTVARSPRSERESFDHWDPNIIESVLKDGINIVAHF